VIDSQRHMTLDGLQIMRGIAAYLVLLLHVTTNPYTVDYFGFALFPVGKVGVDIFFVLSGFIICFTTERQRGAEAFIKKRLARILPIYWSVTLFVFAVGVLVPVIGPLLLGADERTMPALLKSMLFIPYLNDDGTMSPIVSLGWTLNFEMFFYAIFAAGLVLYPQQRLVFALSVVVAAALIGTVVPDTAPAPVLFFTRTIVLEFAFGILIYAAYRHGGALFTGLQRLWPTAVAALFVQLFVTVDGPRVLLFGVPAAILLARCITLSRQSVPWGSALMRLGDASYALYLIHLYVVLATFFIVFQLIPVSLGALVGVTVIISAISIGAAILVYDYFEKPALDGLKRLLLRDKRTALDRSIA